MICYWLIYTIIFLVFNQPLSIKGDNREHLFECNNCSTSILASMNALAEDLKDLKSEMSTTKNEMKNLKDENVQLNNKFQMMSSNLILTNGKMNVIEKSLETAKTDANKIEKKVEIEINNYTKVIQSYADEFQKEKKDLDNQVLNINNTIIDGKNNLEYLKKILHFQGIQSDADHKFLRSLVYTWSISTSISIAEEKVNVIILDEESEEFRVEAYACAVRIKITQSQENIIFKLLSKPEHCLKFPLITFILKDDSGQQREVVRSFSYSNKDNLINANPNEDTSFMFKQSELKGSISKNKVKFEVHVEPLTRPTRAQLLWVVPNVRAKMEQTGISFEMSPSFYTDHQGFRMQTILKFNSKTQKLSAWIVFLRSFEWPIPERGEYKITFTILSPENIANNEIVIHRLSNQRPHAFHLVDLVDYSRIKTIIKGDNMFYKVSVKRE